MRKTMHVLVVKSDFLTYQKGSRITDEKIIADVLASPNKVHVVAAEHEDEIVIAKQETAPVEQE
jgi:hypothetical protein